MSIKKYKPEQIVMVLRQGPKPWANRLQMPHQVGSVKSSRCVKGLGRDRLEFSSRLACSIRLDAPTGTFYYRIDGCGQTRSIEIEQSEQFPRTSPCGLPTRSRRTASLSCKPYR